MGTIAQKLQAVSNSKAAIASAITGKGGTVPTKFSDYGTAIANLPSGGGGPFGSLVDRSITEVAELDLEGVTSIGVNAFNGCSGLLSVTMPDSITSIGSGAFQGCTNLAVVDFNLVMDAVPALYNTDAFSGLPNNYQIWVPGGLISTWKNTYNWINLASHICPNEAINDGQCVSEGNGASVVSAISGTFDANAAFDLDGEGTTMFSENSTLWIGDSINAIDDSGFVSDFGGPMYYGEGGDGCWNYLNFCNIPQEEVETWSGYPWGFPTNKISYLSRPE